MASPLLQMDTVNIGDTDLSSVTYSRKLPILERMCALFLIPSCQNVAVRPCVCPSDAPAEKMAQ